MGAFVNNVITPAGELLAAKALSGEQITFTKIVMGDGFLSQDQTIQTISKVISPKVQIDTIRSVVRDANSVIVGGVFTNKEVQEGFYWRELALYANDPDDGEIMYCYGNSNDLAEYIPSNGSQTLVEKNVDVITYVGNSANVKLYIAPDAYPTKADFDALKTQVNAVISTSNDALTVAREARKIAQQALDEVRKYTNQFTNLQTQVQTLWDAVFSDITANPWLLTFDDIDDITMTSGVYNEDRERLEC